MIDQTAKEHTDGYDSFDMYCDDCDYSQSFDEMDFYEMIKEAKEYGWTIEKDTNGWWHKCPECQKPIN